MNPESPQAWSGIESIPDSSGSVDRAPERVKDTGEKEPAQHETPPIASRPPLPPILPLPPIQDSTSAPQTAPPKDNNTTNIGILPSIASDEDVIEKEWIDKIKRILFLTKDDPYEKSRVIAQLQADYLKKRYNKSLGKVNE